MTYAILSLESGNVLESYRSEGLALAAAARIHETDPQADGSFAVVAFDDTGAPVETLEGDALMERVYPAARRAAHA